MGTLYSNPFTGSAATLVQSLTVANTTVGAQMNSTSGTARSSGSRAYRASDPDCLYITSNQNFGTDDYTVTGVFRQLTVETLNSFRLIGRYTDANNYYFLEYSLATTDVRLYKRVAGVNTQLGSSYSWSPATATDYSWALVMNDTAISVTLGGSTVIGPVTDSALAPGATANYAGFYLQSTAAFNSSNGWHLDSLVVTDFISGSTTIIQGSGMQRLLKDGETNAALKSIVLHVVTSAGAHYNANGETPRIKIGAGAWGDASGAVVGTADSNEYILSDAEAAAASPGELILVYLPATVNHLRSPIAAYEVGPFDPTSSTIDAQVKGMDSAVITAVQSGLATSAGLAPLATASAVSTLDGKVDAVAAYVDTEVAAIKAKTDNLPAAPAAVSDIPSTTSIRNAILTWELWSGMNLARFLRALGVLFRGKSSGQNSLAPSFENDDGSIVLSATIDAQNNRTSVTDNASGTP